MVRLLTDDQLAELGRPPPERQRCAAWRRGVDGYGVWRDLTVAFLTDRFGTAAGRRPRPPCTPTSRRPGSPGPTPRGPTDEELASRWQAEHDRGLDAVCALISHVYRAHGIDVLEQSIRAVGEQTLLAWMPRDIERPPEVRIRTWAAMMHGNFAEITVTEDDEKFVITQDPCGSCGRQLAVRRVPRTARPRDGHRGAPDHLRPWQRARSTAPTSR